jgi:hypothetical protein
MLRNRIDFMSRLVVAVMLCFSVQLVARENIGTAHRTQALKTTTTRCQPATANIDLDINNVRARLMTGGDMWWDLGLQVAAYEVPKGSGHHSQFAASCWIGGLDQQNQLKVAAQTYRQDGNDYWPGALEGGYPSTNSPTISGDQCQNWDKFWKVDKSTINQFIELVKTGGDVSGSQFDVIRQWPGAQNPNATGATGLLGIDQGTFATRTYAPFVDLNKNGIYEPNNGAQSEYPAITGDQYIWWVFNDAGNIKLQSQTPAIGVEIQTGAFAYATQDFLNDATFCQYRVINRGNLVIDSTYIAVWDDCDLGYAFDDYIGCDTSRGLGIQYNGNNQDGADGGFPTNSYGLNPPQVGLDFFQGPKRIIHRAGKTDTFQQLGMTNFTYYVNDASVIGNPRNGLQIYRYMTGSITDGERFSYDYQGPGITSKGYGLGPVVNSVFTGDPGTGHDWSECTCGNKTGDRRFIFSSGPFQLYPGAINDIVFGCVWAPQLKGCPVTSFKGIKDIDDGAQALFESHFKTVEGPQAPRLVVKELDRRLVFYMVNDYGSNNFGENYGRNDGVYNDSLQYHQLVAKATGLADTLYRFQGYRVFQLANSQVTSAEIFDPTTGEVDGTKAFEIFECDKADSVTQIVNYTKNATVSDTTWTAHIKVNGKDSGITHSFEVTEDQFTTSSDKRLINYHNYYFVAIAYAYNNFIPFNPADPNRSQDMPYLGSTHAANGANITTVIGLPNPSNGAMGTVLNADFGSGVLIHRIEGVGNGGNFLQLDSTSEALAVSNNKIDEAVYMQGQGPINVKVIDPITVPAYDWVLQIRDTTANGQVTKNAGWALTAMDGANKIETIYSEQTISTLNEQIIEKYGLSITVNQQDAPGANKPSGNGYMSSDITFNDPTKPWLAGVTDQADSNFANWLRSGAATTFGKYGGNVPCDFNNNGFDLYNNFENMFANYNPVKSSWGPYDLAADWENGFNNAVQSNFCGFELAFSQSKYSNGGTGTQITTGQDLPNLPDVNLVFTSDKTKWTRCAVIELQEDSLISSNHASKFHLRRHAGWNGDLTSEGNPIYSTNPNDAGMSLFPGYAIDENTGKRLDIVFGEDSYLESNHGNDMLWNPTGLMFNTFDFSIVFGGKHVVYILNTPYDSDKVFVQYQKSAASGNAIPLRKAYSPFEWMGVPLVVSTVPMLSWNEGYIPTTTTLRFRVTRPYAPYQAVTPTPDTTKLATFPYYTFTTKDLAKTPVTDATDKNALLDRIYAVPNPYYGYSGYELSRLDTKVRIINLPAVVTINIFSLDGALIRVLTKNDANTSYIDWDTRNSVGLPIASGMYLMDVKAQGIGEKVIKWFGSSRPIDVPSN